MMKDTYVHLTCRELTAAQKKKYLKTGKVSFTAGQLKSSAKKIALHRESAKKWKKAVAAGKGLNPTLTPGEIHASIALDGDSLEGSGMERSSVWSWLKGAAKSVYKFGKDNWDVIKPVLSRVADAAVPAVAIAFGQPGLAVAARTGLKELAGVGVSKKGSPEAKARMAHLRSMREVKSGGSFRL